MTKQDAEFAAWMVKVDSVIQKNTEGTLTTDDLSDHNFWEDFKNELDADEVAHQLLIEEGFVFVD